MTVKGLTKDSRASKGFVHQLAPEVEEFVEQCGNFIEYWGFKRVQGKIWAHLFLSSRPLETQELIRRVGVSKGLMSIYLKEMLKYDVIQEAGVGHWGTMLYRANPDQQSVILNVIRKRERIMLAQVEASLKLLNALPANEKARSEVSQEGIDKATQMVAQASTVMDGVLRSELEGPRIWDKLAKFFLKFLKNGEKNREPQP